MAGEIKATPPMFVSSKVLRQVSIVGRYRRCIRSDAVDSPSPPSGRRKVRQQRSRE